MSRGRFLLSLDITMHQAARGVSSTSFLKRVRLAESRPKLTLGMDCVLLILACFFSPSEAKKRPPRAKDFDLWKNINGQALSRDGHSSCRRCP